MESGNREVRASTMIVYAGESCSRLGFNRLRDLGWGQCCTTGPTEKQELRFFMDNGAWVSFVEGTAFDGARFLFRMERAHERGQAPDFVILPDVVADCAATLALSAKWHPLIPPGWPRYFAVQDGIESWQLAAFFAKYPCEGIFLGGTSWFKNTQAQRWCDFAHERGMKFHYARAGTVRKFEHAMLVGADSLDSSRLSRSGSRWNDFAACKEVWLNGGHPRLFQATEAA